MTAVVWDISTLCTLPSVLPRLGLRRYHKIDTYMYSKYAAKDTDEI